MYMEHANVVFHLDLTCHMENEIRTLNDSDLLSAPRILPLPNSLGPRLLRTAGPLSLPLPISFTLLRLPMFHICEPLLDLVFYLSCISPPFFPFAAFTATFPQPTLLRAQRVPVAAPSKLIQLKCANHHQNDNKS